MSRSTHLKLGVFALVALLGMGALAFALGLRGVRHTSDRYHTYFDESVQGLEIGSPVKYRGVRIGNVSAIEIAPDRKHVEITLALDADDALRLGLSQAAPGLRAQLATQGITGVKFVDLDFASPGAPPRLPFAPEQPYIPARPSLMKGLEVNLEEVGLRLPELVDQTLVTMKKIDGVLDDFHAQGVPARVATAITDLDATVLDLRRLVRGVERAQLPGRAGHAIDDLRGVVSGTQGLIGRLEEQAGVLVSARRAFDAFGDLGAGASGSTEQLDRTLRDLDRAATAVREFFDALDRDPDMLVKGRARTSP